MEGQGSRLCMNYYRSILFLHAYTWPFLSLFLFILVLVFWFLLLLSCRCNKKPCHRNVGASSVGGYLSEWASLPLVITFSILDKLLEPIDHVRFAAVCKGWLCLSKGYNHITQRWRKVLPMLMIPSESEGGTESAGETSNRVLYSVSEGKIYNNIQLQVPNGDRYCSSSHGWLDIVDPCEEELYITLVHPFRKSVAPIQLPSVDYIDLNPDEDDDYTNPYEDRVPKVILSADPHLNPYNYVVMVYYNVDLRLALIKGGRDDWIIMTKPIKCLRDAIFYKSQVYTVGTRGRIVSFDVRGRFKNYKPPKPKLLAPPRVFKSRADKHYLVESTKGDLLHVRRLLEPNGHDKDSWTESFKVYKVVFDDKDGSIVQQVEVKSIGDEALFVGDSHSMSVSASKFPGCQPNSIYYMGDLLRSQHPDGRPFDMAIFNLENETITRFYSLIAWHKGRPWAVWIMPQFNGLCYA